MSMRWIGVTLLVVSLGAIAWLAWHFVVRPKLEQRAATTGSCSIKMVGFRPGVSTGAAPGATQTGSRLLLRWGASEPQNATP